MGLVYKLDAKKRKWNQNRRKGMKTKRATFVISQHQNGVRACVCVCACECACVGVGVHVCVCWCACVSVRERESTLTDFSKHQIQHL